MPTKRAQSTEPSGIERLKASGRLETYRAMHKRLAEGGTVTQPSEPKPEPQPELDPDLFADKKPTTLLQDIQWVYSNLELRVQPEDAPSSGAWGLLAWARKHKNVFYRTHVPKLEKLEAEEPEEAKPSRIQSIVERLQAMDAERG